MSRADLGFLTAEEFRQWLRLRYPREDGWTHERIGEELGLSAGFVGMLLDGTRKPSKAVLNALKMEAVTFYRLKNDPFTGRPWGEVAANAIAEEGTKAEAVEWLQKQWNEKEKQPCINLPNIAARKSQSCVPTSRMKIYLSKA